jgi:hypothetical protein
LTSLASRNFETLTLNRCETIVRQPQVILEMEGTSWPALRASIKASRRFS